MMTKWKNRRRRQWDPRNAEQSQGRSKSWNDNLEADLESNQSDKRGQRLYNEGTEEKSRTQSFILTSIKLTTI